MTFIPAHPSGPTSRKQSGRTSNNKLAYMGVGAESPPNYKGRKAREVEAKSREAKAKNV